MLHYNKVWICGSKGRLGSALRYILNPTEMEIFSTDIIDVDVTNLNEVLLFGERNYPQFIINCSGLSDVDACEKNPEKAYQINAIGARNLAVVANEIEATLIQISTDDVFDGHSQKPYTEFDTPCPQTIYGHSKLAAENFVKEFTERHFIIRSSWLYGKSHLMYFINQAKQTGVCHVAENYIGSPTSTLELGKFIQNLMKTRAFGLYHANCLGTVSRQDYVRKILELANINAEVKEIHPNNTLSKGHPQYAHLDNFMMRLSDMYKMPHWEDALRQFMLGRKTKGVSG